jgi:hypothetical protein
VAPVSFSSFVSRSALSVAAAALALGLLAAPASAQTTTFSGTVYSPLGPAGTIKGDPIPNILVFVEASDPTSQSYSPVPVFTRGIDTSNGTTCAAQEQNSPLTPAVVLGSAISKPDGTFSFNAAGQLPDPVHLYIQAGKWRLLTSIPLANIVIGGNNTFALSMPSAAGTSTNAYGTTTADLPYIAIVTGSADAIECIFPQIGISVNEVTDPTSTGHINFFSGNGASGEIITSSTPTETQLVNPAATNAIPLTNYDLVVFGWQGESGLAPGTGSGKDADVAFSENLVPYANEGGRIFGVHWEYPWVNSQTEWSPLSTFNAPSGNDASDTEEGLLSTSFSGEPILSAWLEDIGVITNPANPEVELTNVFYENLAAVNAPAQTWITLPNRNNLPDQFSFDTPVGVSGTPAAVINFSNSTSTFLTGDPDDVATAAVSNTSNTPTVAGLTLTITIPSVLQILSVADSSGGSWSCTATTATTYTCTLPGPLAAGATDSVAVAFKIPQGTPLGVYSLTGVLSKGGLNGSTQCGRVLYNDYHVEKSIGKVDWNGGKSCTTGSLTAAQKFLEYSLYNLSSFVAPANADTIQIQQSSTISWNIPSPLYYGTQLSQIEDATVNTPGNTVYSFTPNSSANPLDAATYSFTASFTPTDTTDYLSATATQSVVIKPDPTVSTIASLDTSIYYGQEIGYDNGVDATLSVVVQPNLPNLLTTPAVVGGPFSVTIDGTSVCTGTEGTPPTGGTRPDTCPDAGFLGWPAGPHVLTLSYGGITDFLPSSYSATVTINSDPTTTTLTSTGTGSGIVGTSLTYSAAVADIYATVAGNITFYDSPTPVAAGSTPSASMIAIYSTPAVNGAASYSSNTLPVGTHNIAACFAAPNDPAGFPNMAPSCSATAPQVVAPIPVVPDPTATFLRSNANPSSVGQAVTFSSSVSTTGAFITVPTGTLTFYDGGTVIGTSTLDSAGNGSYTTSTLALGTHPITASYMGSASATASVSAVLSQVVTQPLSSAGDGFLLTVTPTTFSVGAGSSVSASVSILDLNNFSQPVQLACAGLPSETTCTFDQPLMPGTGTTRVTFAPAASHGCNSSSPYFVAGAGGPAILWLSVTSLLLFLARKRRRLLQGIALTAALCIFPMLQGCGSGNCTDFGVKPGTYTFTVSGTSTGSPVVVQTQKMTMTVTIN